MGTGLATLLGDTGHDVVMSRRVPDSRPDDPVKVVTFDEAVDHGDVVILAVTHEAVADLVGSLADRLSGKIVVDVTNWVIFEAGRIRSGLPEGTSEGTWLSSILPESRVTRAFNHVQDEMLVSRARRQPGIWGVAVAGDDAHAVAVTKQLVSQVGYVPVEVGDLRSSLVVDPGGPLFPHMFTPADLVAVLQGALH